MIAGFAAWVRRAAMLPPDAVMPVVSTLLLVLAAVFALIAWRHGRMDPDNVTYRDVAGALTLIGLCAAATIDSDQMMRLRNCKPGAPTSTCDDRRSEALEGVDATLVLRLSPGRAPLAAARCDVGLESRWSGPLAPVVRSTSCCSLAYRFAALPRVRRLRSAPRPRPWLVAAAIVHGARRRRLLPRPRPAAAAPPVFVFGIPVDFILFALTLIGVAIFHHQTLQVALTGLAAIVVYKLAFTGFKTGPGLAGLALHMQHEWVVLANLFLLLMGFAILSRHFEKSRIPDEMPALPAGRLAGRARAARDRVRALELPRQHRGRADRRHDGAPRVPGQGAHRLPRGDRGGLERRRLRQRGRRHHDHDDVDRRHQPAVGRSTPMWRPSPAS